MAEALRKRVDNEVLISLGDELDIMGTCLENFGLPVPDRQSKFIKVARAIQEEMFDVDRQKETSEIQCQSLNSDQQEAFHAVMKTVNENHPQAMFFLNAPGDYGKTFLLETLLFTVWGMGKIALVVASSGIAAELLEGGRTAHSQFKIPIPVNESSVCSVRRSSLIIWDEVMMSHVHQVDCVDRSLRDIMKNDKPFGGIPIV